MLFVLLKQKSLQHQTLYEEGVYTELGGPKNDSLPGKMPLKISKMSEVIAFITLVIFRLFVFYYSPLAYIISHV